MSQGLTELVFILDKSGSMAGLEGDTIGGFNSMLRKQQELEGECRITTVLFDNNYELLHDRIDVRAVSPITETEYNVGGSTALLDAMGRTIKNIAKTQKRTATKYRTQHVMFVIITDGYENASKKYSSDQVKRMVERKTEAFGWEFIYLGANIDAVETAQQMGIRADRAQDFHADDAGIRLSMKVVSEAAADYRCGAPIAQDWSEELEKDYASRASGISRGRKTTNP